MPNLILCLPYNSLKLCQHYWRKKRIVTRLICYAALRFHQRGERRKKKGNLVSEKQPNRRAETLMSIGTCTAFTILMKLCGVRNASVRIYHPCLSPWIRCRDHLLTAFLQAGDADSSLHLPAPYSWDKTPGWRTLLYEITNWCHLWLNAANISYQQLCHHSQLGRRKNQRNASANQPKPVRTGQRQSHKAAQEGLQHGPLFTSPWGSVGYLPAVSGNHHRASILMLPEFPQGSQACLTRNFTSVTAAN